MKVEPVILQGERVILVPMESAHTNPLYEALKDPEIWTYSPPGMRSIDDMKNYVDTALEERARGDALPFVIRDLETDRLVGTTRFADISAQHRHLEIGWTALAREVWRTRVNTECKYLLLQHCFETLGTVRVQLKADSRNTRSLRAIERIGAISEGIHRSHRILNDGYIRDTVYYSFIVSDWPEAKMRLEKMLVD
ncbi:GNAT family N-acetyltransferase [Paenibacillus radicis (ex Xue et al. 2023)]|uniref:GNAT family N-acetyltransferase n=1 Tax=Paenibacillus radicis (ex Xue et al. 2023) TaxID=2972489 RepID=A0ABT1YAU3_9BACL|nr:GNAT family N-acetyltransferase [Paenibacillus radicis (ex Xue et al. 2023)]MCR8630307.1 GNAT family N-acetyltransferase [Paenibacillus radicis (ex Xue et al. 2023)]